MCIRDRHKEDDPDQPTSSFVESPNEDDFSLLNNESSCSALPKNSVPPPQELSLIHISEPTRQAEISYAVFCFEPLRHFFEPCCFFSTYVDSMNFIDFVS